MEGQAWKDKNGGLPVEFQSMFCGNCFSTGSFLAD